MFYYREITSKIFNIKIKNVVMIEISKLNNEISSKIDKKYLDDWFVVDEEGKVRISNLVLNNYYVKLDDKNKNLDYLDLSLQICYLFEGVNDVLFKYEQVKKIEKMSEGFEGLSLIDSFKLVCDVYSKDIQKKFKKVSNLERERNCELVNFEQELFLKKKYNFEEKLTNKKRKLVLYFRDNNLYGEPLVDSFDFSLMCYILDIYVNCGYSKLFTDIVITSRDYNFYPKILPKIFPKIKYEYGENTGKGDNFTKLTGVCANTVHFTNGKFKDILMGSVPCLPYGVIEDIHKMEFFAKGLGKDKLVENYDYVRNNFNYEKFNLYFKSGSVKKVSFFDKIFSKENNLSISQIMEEIVKSVLELENVVIKKARDNLTKNEMN